MRQAKFQLSPIFVHFKEWVDNRKSKLTDDEFTIAWESWKEATINERRLQDAVVMFIEKHGITCSEAIYQDDRVINDAYEFMDKLISMVGYLPTDGNE